MNQESGKLKAQRKFELKVFFLFWLLDFQKTVMTMKIKRLDI